MTTTWVISDTHFGHAKCWEVFKGADGVSPMRPFTSTEEMDETMVDNWNRVVGKNDRVIHVGDVVINKKFLPILDRLNGIKELVEGNHDQHKNKALLVPYFRKCSAMKEIAGIVFSHFPMHPDSVERFGTNVHGHLHSERVMWDVLKIDEDELQHHPDQSPYRKVREIDPRYFNVSVEQINYTPISVEDLRIRIKEQQEAAGYEPKKAWGSGSNPAI